MHHENTPLGKRQSRTDTNIHELLYEWKYPALIRGHVAALVRSHMNGLLPFERTIEQTI